MTIKRIDVEGLRNCPVCGKKAILRRNASKRFQVHCTKCSACTPWRDKTDAIITWYNNAELYEKLHGIPQTTESEPAPISQRKRMTGEAAQKLADALAEYITAEHEYHSSLDRLEDAKREIKQ